MKITGCEFKKFYKDNQYWDEESYHDGEILVTQAGKTTDDIDLTTIDDDCLVNISNATVFLHSEHEGIALTSYFKKWRKQQSIRHLLVEIHESKVTKLKSYVRSLGGKV